MSCAAVRGRSGAGWALSGPARARFERHFATCAERRAETDALAELGALARARTEDPDDLRAGRGARQLLGTFNAALTEPPPSRPRAWLLVPALLVAALLALRFVPHGAAPQLATPDPARAASAAQSASPAMTARAAAERATAAASASNTTPSSPPPSPGPSDAGPTPNPSAEYRAAVAKLQAGDDRAAATAFEQFTKKYPTHESAEDAAYLRVVALDHAGDRPATEAAANDYLATPPASANPKSRSSSATEPRPERGAGARPRRRDASGARRRGGAAAQRARVQSRGDATRARRCRGPSGLGGARVRAAEPRALRLRGGSRQERSAGTGPKESGPITYRRLRFTKPPP